MSRELGLDLEALLRQRDWLRALARGLVREGDVDDLLQESWLAALGTGTRPRRSLGAWFTGLARNAARGLRRRGPSPEGDCQRIADERPAAGELLARAELQEHLIAAVRALREPYRTTVLLHYFEGLTLEDVGRRQGVPGSTARTRLARALEELRGRLGREREEGTWGLVAALAREGAAPGAVSLASAVGKVTLMGMLPKVGGAALAAGIVFFLWTRLDEPARSNAGAREEPGATLSAVSSAGSARGDTPAPTETRAPVASAPAAARSAGSVPPGEA